MNKDLTESASSERSGCIIVTAYLIAFVIILVINSLNPS